MRKKILAFVFAAVLLVVTATPAVAAPAHRDLVQHNLGSGGTVNICIRDSAALHHVAHHGDIILSHNCQN